MDPKQKLDVVITIDIAQILTVDEFVNVLSEPLVSGKTVTWEDLDKQFNLKGRKFYIRNKSLPEVRMGSDVVVKPAKLEIGC